MKQDAGQAMKERMRADLREVMKAGGVGETKLIRVLIAAIDNAEAPPLAARSATDRPHFLDGSTEITRLSLGLVEVRSILARERQEREVAAAEMARLSMSDRAEALCGEARIIGRYLVPG